MEKVTVVKIGGKVINEESELDAFLKKFSTIEGHKVLVHGGGNIASNLQEQLGVPVKMVEGRRITDQEAIDIVSLVFSGLNKKIVAKLQSNSVKSLGLSGADMSVILSQKRTVKTIDYGYVGDIQSVDSILLKQLLGLSVLPVFCALTHDGQGQLLNTNADTIASELARALSKDFKVDLVYCFEQPGVLSDFENKIVIPEITFGSFQKLKEDGTINAGMIPKLDNAFAAIEDGVNTVKICHFDDVHQVQSDEYAGTTLCSN